MMVIVKMKPNTMRGTRTHCDLCFFRNPYTTSAQPKRMKSTMRESQNRDFVRYVRNIRPMVHFPYERDHYEIRFSALPRNNKPDSPTTYKGNPRTGNGTASLANGGPHLGYIHKIEYYRS